MAKRPANLRFVYPKGDSGKRVANRPAFASFTFNGAVLSDKEQRSLIKSFMDLGVCSDVVFEGGAMLANADPSTLGFANSIETLARDVFDVNRVTHR